jgi:hypothetical protein
MLGQDVEVVNHGPDGKEALSRSPVFGVWCAP